MRPIIRLMLPLACLVAGPAVAGELALERVMLSTAGVGYFEYGADVDGNTTLGIDIPLDQVDDVLKSLVVFDSAGGVGGIELPGRDASRAAFGDVPFGSEALATPLDFLNSLQGIRMRVAGPRPMEGTLMRAEAVHEPAGTSPDGTARAADCGDAGGDGRLSIRGARAMGRSAIRRRGSARCRLGRRIASAGFAVPIRPVDRTAPSWPRIPPRRRAS